MENKKIDIEIEGIQLHEELIEFIRDCQKTDGFLSSLLENIDKAIAFIACGYCEMIDFSDRETLQLIADIAYLKQYLKLLNKTPQ